MAERPEQELIALAARLCDDLDIDWGRLEAAAGDDHHRTELRNLRIVAEIVRVHRAALGTDNPDEAAGDRPPQLKSTPEASQASRATERWRHLVLRGAIGRGTHGDVRRAWDPTLEREVALKLVRVDRASGPAVLQRAVQEARTLARIRHPHVVMVHGAEEQSGTVGIWMELVEGRTLGDIVEAGGPLSAQEVALIGIDLCGALAAVHGAGLLHRDIKARNVIREKGGRIVLMDFGGSIPRKGADEAVAAGTPLYMAPEVLGGGSADVQSDLYSLGILLYYLSSGRYPIEATTVRDVRQAHEGRRFTRLRDARPDLPPAFVACVERAISSDPRERFRTAGDLEEALLRVVGREKVPPLPARRGRAAAGIAVIAGVAAAALMIGLWLASGRQDVAPRSTSRPQPAEAVPPQAATAYTVEGAFYRSNLADAERLGPDARMTIGDRLFFEIRASADVHVYVINQDDRGASYLLFPLPGHELQNPLRASRSHRLPGRHDGQQVFWQVTTAGDQERFLVIASPERLDGVERELASLRTPQSVTAPTTAMLLPEAALERLRGVGGLVQSPGVLPRGVSGLLDAATPLASGPETVQGTWVRRIAFVNPR